MTHSISRRSILASAAATLVSAPVFAEITNRARVGATAHTVAPQPTKLSPIAGGRPITLLVSYAPGGGADMMARLIAPKMAEILGQDVIVENKPGAGGQIAATQVARGRTDGTQLLFDASSFAVNPGLYPKLAYDADKDFDVLGVLALFDHVLVCTPSFAAKNVKDLVRMADQNPGSIAYASSGNGSAQHLAGALFETQANVKLMHVPYKGGGPAMVDVMAGHVPLFFANIASSMSHIESGKLRAMAVTSRRRTRKLPNVPTMEESGVRGVEVQEWNPIIARRGIDPATRSTLLTALMRVQEDPEVLGKIRSLSGEMFQMDGQNLANGYVKAQQVKWRKVIEKNQILPG